MVARLQANRNKNDSKPASFALVAGGGWQGMGGGWRLRVAWWTVRAGEDVTGGKWEEMKS